MRRERSVFALTSAIGCAIVIFLSIGVAGMFSLFIPEYMAEYGYSKMEMSYVAMVATVSGFLFSLIGSKLINALGPKKSLLVGSLASAVFLCLIGSVDNLVALGLVSLAQGAVLGLGAHASCAGVIAGWYGDRMASVIGVVFGFSSFGSTVFSLLAGQLLKVMSYHTILVSFGIGAAVIGVLANLLLIRMPAAQRPAAESGAAAAPTEEEMQGVPHHMVGVIDPREDYSVARYAADAAECVDGILARGKLPILVGGTGLYLDALLRGHGYAPGTTGGETRRLLERRWDNEGGEALFAELRSIDPESAAVLHPNDKKRVIRALEVYEETGKTITQHNLETKAVPPRYRPVWIGLDYQDRAALYRRIDLRVENMLSDGLLDEIRALLALGVSPKTTAMQAIGYKEFFGYLSGACSLDEAAALCKQRSRNYAKRQLTWFRRNPDVHWLRMTGTEDFSEVLSAARQNIPFSAL